MNTHVDEKVSSTSTLEEDAERWQEDGEEDLEDVAARVRR